MKKNETKMIKWDVEMTVLRADSLKEAKDVEKKSMVLQ